MTLLLSCDEKSVVFVRRIPGSLPDGELGTKSGAEIWTIPIQVPAEAHRVFSGDRAHAEWVGLVEPQFAADPNTVYFMRWFGNGYELDLLSLDPGRVKRVAASVREFWVVCNGLFKNDIVVEEDQLKLAGGHVNLYWLYDDKE